MQTLKTAEIETAIRAQNLLEINQTILPRINTAELQTSLSPLVLYCSKTGQPLGAIDPNSLASAMAIYSRVEMADLLFHANTNAIHPAWKKTASNENQYNYILDKLAECDPCGYAVYCLNIISAALKPLAAFRNNSADYWSELHWSRARAFQIVSLIPSEELTELNDTLCAFISYMPKSLIELEALIGRERIFPDLMARMAFAKTLLPTLNSAINETTESRIRAKKAESRSIWETNLAIDEFKGPTQFKKQRSAIRRQQIIMRKAKQSKADKKARELSSIYGLGDLFAKAKPVSNTDAWSLRASKDTVIITPNLDAEKTEIPLEFLEALDMEDFGETENDNTVEIRRISRDELPSVIAAKEAAENPAPIVPAVPAKSLAEKLAARIAAPQTEIPVTEKPIVSGWQKRFVK